MIDISTVFECQQCGDCCFGNGGIRLNQSEAAEVAFYLKISLEELRKLYLDSAPAGAVGRGVGGRRAVPDGLKTEAPPLSEEASWNVRTDFEGYCLFRQADGRCLIHAVKPEVCRRWPFLPGPLKDRSAFEDAKAACPGLKDEAGWEDFKAAWRGEEEKQA